MTLATPNFGIESGIDGLRRHLTDELSLKFEPISANDLATSGHSSFKKSLLTPPLLKDVASEVPFKAKDDDDVSLNMKRSQGLRRKRLNRQFLSSGGTDDIASRRSMQSVYLDRSKSSPSLRTAGHLSPQSQLEKRHQGLSNNNELPRRHRRWTVAVKALPSTELTDTSPPCTLSAGSAGTSTRGLTPAMISLRRATTIKCQTPPLVLTSTYTSFPPPTFSRTNQNFLSIIFGEPCETRVALSPDVPRRGSSVKNADAAPCCGGVAAPVTTEVVFYPCTIPPQCTRRCPTRYVSKNSVYEIIWDENVSDPSSESNSMDLSRRGSKGKAPSPKEARKRSAAFDRLEAQLLKPSTQSRRESLIAPHQQIRSPNSLPEISMSSPKKRRKSLQSLLEFKFSRFKNEAALSNLPRSKASATKTTSPYSSKRSEPDFAWLVPDLDVKATGCLDILAQSGSEPTTPGYQEFPLYRRDQNPPLSTACNRKRSLAERTTTRDTANSGRGPPGSLIGQSSHRRRHTTHLGQRRGPDMPNNKGLSWRRPSSTLIWPRASYDEECLPLLV